MTDDRRTQGEGTETAPVANNEANKPAGSITNKRLAANRKNALNSTGARTATGKSRSSQNALKHGILSATPILEGLESPKAWKKHRDGIMESISSVGYLEKALTIRLTETSWRLARVARYEAEVSAASVARTEADLDEKGGKPPDPSETHEEIQKASFVIQMLEALPKLSDEERIDAESAKITLWALWHAIPKPVENITIPGIPDDDAEFNVFDNWTAALLRRATEVYAAAARMSPRALVFKCVSSAHNRGYAAQKYERQLVARGKRWELLLKRENLRRMLLEPDLLRTMTRYESNLERSFFRILHEIQRLQAARRGLAVPVPEATDVDVSGKSEKL